MPSRMQDFLNSTSSFSPLKKKVLGTVIFVHCALTMLLLFPSPPKEKKVAKLLVHTINLQKEHIADSPIAATTEQEPLALTPIEKKPQKSSPKQPQKKKKRPKPTQTKKKKSPPQKKAPKKAQEELVSQALDSLNKVASLSSKKESLHTSQKDHPKNPKKIETLATESLAISDETSLTPEEKSYLTELIRRLKTTLKLPDFGEVKVRLCITKTGKVKDVKIVSAKSTKNRAYIEKTLPSMQFASFGNYFSQEQEHTFLLNLSNELRY